MKQLQYRHEYKHTINLLDYWTIKQRLKAITQPDPHANADGRYQIRSLYFDNDADKALREKLDGLPNREKYRLRLYNGNEDLIRLEKKSKVDGLCTKQGTTVTRTQAEQILVAVV